MNTKTLFVTDLDGTLLQPGGTLSPYARERLTHLIEAGVLVTIATARSIVSLREAVGNIPFRLPLICGNGAYLTDPYTDRHLHLHAMAPPLVQDLWGFILEAGFFPMLNSCHQDEDRLYIGPVMNEAMAWYKADREAEEDPRLAYVDDWEGVMAADMICFNILERREALAELETALQARYPGQIVCYTYENWYSPEWHWLSIFDQRATKAGGIRAVMADLGVGPEQVVVFGDSHNDLSMFDMGVRAVAPANAIPAVLALATEVIGTNDTDSVIKYIEKATGHAAGVGPAEPGL